MPTKYSEQRFLITTLQRTSKLSATVVARKSRTSSGLKDFRSKIQSKENATTALSAYEEILFYHKNASLSCSRSGDSIAVWETTPNLKFPEPAILVSLNMQNQAIARARGALNSYLQSQLTPLQAQVFAGELKETVDFLKQPLAGIVKAIVALLNALIALKKHKKDSKAYKELANEISGLWLEFRFAVLPLAADLDAIIDIIVDKSKETHSFKKRFYGFSEDATSSMTDSSIGVNDISILKSVNVKLKAECFIHCGIGFYNDSKSTSKLEGTLQDLLSIDNLPSTLWELTPLSFLIDYFINIGDFIEGVTSTHGALAYVSETLVLTAEQIDSFYGHHILPGSYYTKIDRSIPGGSHLKKRVITRSASTSAIPPVYVSIPGSNIRYANIAALITSLLTS